jgi:hypothetical protein
VHASGPFATTWISYASPPVSSSNPVTANLHSQSPHRVHDDRVCLVSRASRGRTLPCEARTPSTGAILVHHPCKLHVAGRLWQTLDTGTGNRVLRSSSDQRARRGAEGRWKSLDVDEASLEAGELEPRRQRGLKAKRERRIMGIPPKRHCACRCSLQPYYGSTMLCNEGETNAVNEWMGQELLDGFFFLFCFFAKIF